MTKKSLASPKEIQIPDDRHNTLSLQESDLNRTNKKEGEELKKGTVHSLSLFLIIFIYLPLFATFFPACFPFICFLFFF